MSQGPRMRDCGSLVAEVSIPLFFWFWFLERKVLKRTFIPQHSKSFFFSYAALLKTVAVMSLQTLGQKEADNYSPEQQKQNQNSPTQHTKPGSGCGKRDVKRVVRNDVRQPDSLPIHYSKALIRSDVHLPKIP